MTASFYRVVDGTTSASQVYAEDVNQTGDVLSAVRDGGQLSLLAPLVSPAAPVVTKQAGSVTGTGYQWGVYWITGLLDGTSAAHIAGRTPYGTLTASTSLTAQQGTVSIASLTPPNGTIGWGVVRNKSGGGAWFVVPGSEQFPATPTGALPTTFVDNVVDGSLVSAGPAANTTGTTLSIPVRSYIPTWASSGTAPAIGDATVIAEYVQVGMVQAHGSIAFGAGSTFGTGSYTFALPVPPSANAIASGNGVKGVAYLQDTSANNMAQGMIHITGGGLMNILFGATYLGTVTAVGQLAPWTWAVSDVIAWEIMYPAA